MNHHQQVARVQVSENEGEPGHRVTVVCADGRTHTVVGRLTNELVIHPDGGIYLRLMLRPVQGS